jgi:hypothetical protein
MVIIETKLFTKQITEFLSEEDYRAFQLRLVENPALGPKEPGTGGLRKVRIPAMGHGKRGGARIMYFWAVAKHQLLLLYVFPKGTMSQLTAHQKNILKKIVEEDYQ